MKRARCSRRNAPRGSAIPSKSATKADPEADIFARLAQRREEFERSALARACAIAEPAETADPEYGEGLRLAVSASFEYGLAALTHGTGEAPPVPPALLAQARLAARNGVSLDTVLRRYFAGFTLFGDFVMEEAESAGLPEGTSPQGLLAAEATHFDRLVEEVSEEHSRERERRFRTPEQRRAELVRGLLAGELVDARKLGYELDAWHIAAIGEGDGAAAALHNLAAALDRRLLLIRPGGPAVWAWLGGREAIESDRLLQKATAECPAGVALTLGEPAEGLGGWRFSHRQAKAALPVARGRGGVIRYAEVCLLASALQDEVLTDSLRRLCLEPLAGERDGGKLLRETLRAYFEAGRNGSSAAALLGVKRHTVTNRLRTVEALIGRPISACSAEIEAALLLEGLGEKSAVRR